jgi:tetratricopeptide (TPR) repeat protein
VVGLVILVAVFLMIPFVAWTTRSKGRRGVRWRGIDWTRGMSEAAKLVVEGKRLQQAGAYAQAIEAFDQSLMLEPDVAEPLLARAVARHRLGQLDASLADYDRAIALHGPTSDALNNRGCLHRDRGDLERAVADMTEAIRLAPDYAVAHVSLAEALAQRGDWDGALASLRRGVEQDATWRDYARSAGELASLREARPDADVFAP